LRTRRSTS
jgi:hypothetical protein